MSDVMVRRWCTHRTAAEVSSVAIHAPWRDGVSIGRASHQRGIRRVARRSQSAIRQEKPKTTVNLQATTVIPR